MGPRVHEVVWAESARDALDEVIAYIAEDSPQAAARVLEEALRAGASLATFSERGLTAADSGARIRAGAAAAQSPSVRPTLTVDAI